MIARLPATNIWLAINLKVARNPPVGDGAKIVERHFMTPRCVTSAGGRAVLVATGARLEDCITKSISLGCVILITGSEVRILHQRHRTYALAQTTLARLTPARLMPGLLKVQQLIETRGVHRQQNDMQQ